FQFAKEAGKLEITLKILQESIKEKYSVDKSSSFSRVETMTEDAESEKAKFTEYKAKVSNLSGKAKTQSDAETAKRNTDQRRVNIVVIACLRMLIKYCLCLKSKCFLHNAHNYPVNKNSKPKLNNLTTLNRNIYKVGRARRLEQLYAEVWTLWNALQGNLQSVAAWQRLRQDTDTIKSWTTDSVKLAPRTETESGLERMETHFRELNRFKAQAGSSINAADHAQSERDVTACRKYYKELLERITKESQQENAMAGLHSQLQTFTPRVEDLEREITLILRTLLERDHVQDNSKRIGQQQKLHGEVVKLQGDLGRINQQSASIVASQPTLQTSFQGANQRMGLLNNYSSMALDELKSMDGLVRSTKQAEDIVREYETKLCDGASVPGDIKGIDNLISNLKRWQAELQQKQQAFSALEQQLQATRAANDRLASAHRERDANLDAHQARVQQLLDRWARVGSHSKMRRRVQQLENLRQLMQQYFDLRTFFMSWFDQATSQLQKLQEAKGESNEEIALLLSQLEKIRMEITNNAQKLGDYQRNSEELTGAIKNYESLLLKYRSQIETSYTNLPPQQTASMESFKQDVSDTSDTELQSNHPANYAASVKAPVYIVDAQKREEMIYTEGQKEKHARIGE
uniref:Desmoplakin spectrin-like domain-containing protein n=1 Tax=Petromyzon marinus TaxID=7757 RepID=S4RAM4_PETMA